MTITALVFAGLAAAVHVYIFVLESLRWTAPATRKVFGTSAQEAETTKLLAFNQGFYNLFLAVVTAVGIGFTSSGGTPVGPALLLAGLGCMLAAAVVLAASAPDKLRGAVIQGVFPLVAIIAVLIGGSG